MKQVFPKIPFLFDALFRPGHWRQGSALARLFAPYGGGAVLALSHIALSVRGAWWWVWIVAAFIIVTLIVRIAAVPAGFAAPAVPRYAIPSMLVLGGGGMYMTANGAFARTAVTLLFCFAMVAVLRVFIRVQIPQSGDFSLMSPVLFSSSPALFSVAVSIAVLATLLNFSSAGAVAIVLLSCLAVTQQALWWTAKTQGRLTVWSWTISLICAETFLVTLLLPLPIISGAALVWLLHSGLIELFRLRLRGDYTGKRILVLSSVYSSASIVLLLTARWP